MISESRRFAISNVMLVLSIGLLAFVSMDSFGTGCANAATGSCQVGDTETFSADLGLGGDVIFEGATDDDFETSLTATDPTADRTVTVPDADGTIVLSSNAGAAGEVLVQTGSGVPAYSSFSAGTEEWWCISDPISILSVPPTDYYYAVSNPLYGNKCQTIFTDEGIYEVEIELTLKPRTSTAYGTAIICTGCGTADTLRNTAKGFSSSYTSSLCHRVNPGASSPIGTNPIVPYSTTTVVHSLTCSSSQMRYDTSFVLSSTFQINPGEIIDFTNGGANGLGVRGELNCGFYACTPGDEYVDFGPLKMHIIKIS